MNATIRLLVALVTICALGLVAGVVIVSMQSVATERRLSALEQYVAGKGEQRDAENARQNERIDEAVCRVLDQLPAGGELDAVRSSYGCGPGLPPTSAAPETSTPGAAATAAPGPDAASPTRPDGEVTTAPASPPSTTAGPSPAGSAPPTGAAAPTSAAPTSSPSPAPELDRGPVTDLLCGLLPLCPT